VSYCLESMAPCFQGLIPATLYTCSREGIPNVAYLSHVEYVDASHVALSFQFFNKSHKNISENPLAMVKLMDPDTGQGWKFRLRYVRSETSGPVFESMALRIEAIASYCGLKGIFRLLAADIYEVLSVESSLEESGRPEGTSWIAHDRHAPVDPVFTMKALQHLGERLHQADSLECLLESILAALEEFLGFTHSMILLTGRNEGELVTIASRGYPNNGVGAEARFGEGIIGMVAEARKPIRISGLLRAMLYAYAVHTRAQEQGVVSDHDRIPLPGLAQPESQLGVPLLVRGELIGVLCIESETPYRFHEDDRATVELLGRYLAIAIQNMMFKERAEAAETAPLAPRVAGTSTMPRVAATASDVKTCTKREIVYYRTDECVMVDGEYLIRSLPANIFWKLVSARASEGRTEFTNRELRLDKSLNLPEWKDNLESRLLLLRRRLEQKVPDIRIIPRARGRFSLELGCELVLQERT
jgi:GAF domain-containing protein